MTTSFRKMTALLLGILVFLAPVLSFRVYASGDIASSANTVAAVIQNAYPTSVVEIEDGTIHVFLPDSDRNQQTRASASSMYAPEGGSWTGYIPPYYYYLQTPVNLPVLKTYLPNEQAKTLNILLNEPDLLDFIRNLNIVGYGVNAIISAIQETFHITFTAAQVAISLSDDIMDLYGYVNQRAFNRAFLASTTNKVVVEFTTCDGVPVNYYSPWESNYVDDSPWSDCSPVFQRGVYYV